MEGAWCAWAAPQAWSVGEGAPGLVKRFLLRAGRSLKGGEQGEAGVRSLSSGLLSLDSAETPGPGPNSLPSTCTPFSAPPKPLSSGVMFELSWPCRLGPSPLWASVSSYVR